MRCKICGVYLDTRTDADGNVYTYPASIADADVAHCIARTDGRRGNADRVPLARALTFADVGAPPCPACHGRGHVPECIHVAQTCDTCDGTGYLETRAAELRRVCVPCSADMLDNADRVRHGYHFSKFHGAKK